MGRYPFAHLLSIAARISTSRLMLPFCRSRHRTRCTAVAPNPLLPRSVTELIMAGNRSDSNLARVAGPRLLTDSSRVT